MNPPAGVSAKRGHANLEGRKLGLRGLIRCNGPDAQFN